MAEPALSIVETTIGNVEAEIALLGAMLRDPKVIDQIVDRLNGEDFADPFLGHIFGTIAREHSLGRALNPVTLRPFLEKEPAFEELGGWPWLASIGTNSTVVIAAHEGARQIAEFAQRRRLIEGLREAINQAADPDQPVEQVIELADTALTSARSGDEGRGEHSGADCIKSVIESFDKPVSGVECDIIPSIDKLLGPLRPGHLVIGAGRPGMGKTATAISYALGAAANGHGVLFISLEMRADELGERMTADICLPAQIPYAAIRDRKLNSAQRREVCRAHATVDEMPLVIVDKAGLSVSGVRTIVRRWARRMAARGQKLELVIVDYLQLMQGTTRGQDRYQIITEASIALKALAKEADVAVLALSQLSRKVEERGDKRPMMSDLRESGQIEQDADAILFFLRDEYYLRAAEPPQNHPLRIEWEGKLREAERKIEFICAKRRNGSTGSEVGTFHYEYQAVRG